MQNRYLDNFWKKLSILDQILTIVWFYELHHDIVKDSGSRDWSFASVEQRVLLGPVIDQEPGNAERNDNRLEGNEEASPQIKWNHINVLVCAFEEHVFIDSVKFDLTEVDFFLFK